MQAPTPKKGVYDRIYFLQELPTIRENPTLIDLFFLVLEAHQGEKMKKRVVWILIILIVLLLGWAVKHFYFPVPVETPKTEEIAVPPAPAPNIDRGQEQKPAAPVYQEEGAAENQLAPQRITTGRILNSEAEPVDLSSQTMSIRKEEKKRLEIMPGVKVRSGGVDISLDKENTRTIEVRPNSQGQVMLKQKF